MNFCIVIPVHNEAKAIGSVVAAVKERGWPVVVVDDGSTDNSSHEATQSGATVLRNEEKTGKGLSLQRGFEYILKHDYDGVIAMDGDGQHDAGDLDGFVEAIRQHPETIVVGNRMAAVGEMPLIRRLTNRGMSWLISKICKQRIPDTQCGFRYISRGILSQLNLNAGDYEIETEVLIKASKKGVPIHSIPIKTIYRNEESKIHPFKDTVRFFSYLLKEMRS